ncbi:MAG: Fis family transcriptional regulator [Alteromonadaceae bacterium]|nr:MAG: Fis family transcriptional regulator [Alteromonadaceae bacterium]
MIRREPIKSSISHERWLVSYADFITLLFAFFVVMYSVSQVNEQKYKVLSDTLSQVFAPSGIKNTSVPGDTNAANTNTVDIEQFAQQLQSVLAPLLDQQLVDIDLREQWVDISLPSQILFESGSAKIQRDARSLFSQLADLLAPIDNAIGVHGHTDDVAISTSQFADNWALSSARAVSIVSLLAYQGVNPRQLTAVAWGEYQPVADNATAEGRARNRRVVLRISRQMVPMSEQETIGPAPEPASVGNAGSVAAEMQAPTTSVAPITPLEAPGRIDNSSPSALKPLKLQGGGLLFTSDPDLPRLNKVIESP